MLLLAFVAAVAGLLAATGLAGATALILPMARYSNVTQATISSTICKTGWTATIRPPASYTNALKRAQLAEWHYADQNPSHLRGGPPDLARARRCSMVEEEPLARAALTIGQERSARERLAQEGLQRDADAQAGASAGARLQAGQRLTPETRF